MAGSRNILPAPSKSEHQIHPPGCARPPPPHQRHRQPRMCQVTRFRLIRHRLIFPPGDVRQAAFRAGAGLNFTGTQGAADKPSPPQQPQKQGQGQAPSWGRHQLRTLTPSKVATASNTQGLNLSPSFVNLAGTRRRAHPAAAPSWQQQVLHLQSYLSSRGKTYLFLKKKIKMN